MLPSKDVPLEDDGGGGGSPPMAVEGAPPPPPPRKGVDLSYVDNFFLYSSICFCLSRLSRWYIALACLSFSSCLTSSRSRADEDCCWSPPESVESTLPPLLGSKMFPLFLLLPFLADEFFGEGIEEDCFGDAIAFSSNSFTRSSNVAAFAFDSFSFLSASSQRFCNAFVATGSDEDGDKGGGNGAAFFALLSAFSTSFCNFCVFASNEMIFDCNRAFSFCNSFAFLDASSAIVFDASSDLTRAVVSTFFSECELISFVKLSTCIINCFFSLSIAFFSAANFLDSISNFFVSSLANLIDSAFVPSNSLSCFFNPSMSLTSAFNASHSFCDCINISSTCLSALMCSFFAADN